MILKLHLLLSDPGVYLELWSHCLMVLGHSGEEKNVLPHEGQDRQA